MKQIGGKDKAEMMVKADLDKRLSEINFTALIKGRRTYDLKV